MTDIEAKALALVNEVLEGKALNNTPFTRLPTAVSSLVLLRAIEQHEAFRQEVSDVMTYIKALYPALPRNFDRFIIPKPKPKPKPDPLVDVLKDFGGFMPDADDFRAALEARGLEIRSKNDE